MANEMKVHILHCGALSADLTNLLLAPGKSIQLRSERQKPAPWVEAPTLAILVEHPEGRLLFDNSCPRDWEERWGPTGLQEVFPYDVVSEDEYFDSRLTQLGLGPEDIDINVVSHLHFDHAANTKMLASAGARIIVNDKEKDFALSFDSINLGAHLKSDYDGVEMETISGDTELLPGVTFIEAPGHTIGTMAMQVDLPDSGTMIFTSDAIYLNDSYGPPAVGAAIVWNNMAWMESVEKIRSLAERTNATLVFGHDAEQVTQLRRSPDGYYT